MRKMKKYILVPGIILVAAIIGFVSCKRDFALKNPVTTTEGTAFLRIIDVSPNFRNIYGLPDSFNVYVNGVKITGYTAGTPLIMTYNAIYPNVSTNYGYVSVPAGTMEIELTIGAVKPDSVTIKAFTKTLVANQMYTFMITDSLNSTRDSSKIFVQDSYAAAPTSYFNLRFIHAVLNDTVGKAIDIWSTRANRYIFSNIKPGAISSFTAYPYNATYSDTLYVRRSDATHFPLDTLNTVNFSNMRTYTLYYKGDGTTRNTTANPKGRHLATYLHQ